MGVDCLALAISKSPNRAKTEEIIKKELGLERLTIKNKESILYEMMEEQVKENRLPFINRVNEVEFLPYVAREKKTPSA